STLAAHSFPSLRRFLTLAPACWSRGKIPPHPSARSAHSSPQNGGPKGKMIEGRTGGSGRGTRKELWAHLTAVLQPADRTLYRVPTLDPRRPLISFPPPLPHPRTCLLVTGKNSAAPERTFSSLVSAEWRAQRENDRREERGIWAGHSKRIVGPPDSGSSTSGSYVVSCTD